MRRAEAAEARVEQEKEIALNWRRSAEQLERERDEARIQMWSIEDAVIRPYNAQLETEVDSLRAGLEDLLRVAQVFALCEYTESGVPDPEAGCLCDGCKLRAAADRAEQVLKDG